MSTEGESSTKSPIIQTAANSAGAPTPTSDISSNGATITAFSIKANGAPKGRGRIIHILKYVVLSWGLVLLTYYLYVIVHITLFIAQHGIDAISGKELSEALLIPQLSSFARQNLTAGILLLILVAVFTGIEEWAIIATPFEKTHPPTGSYPVSPPSAEPPTSPSITDQHVRQIYQWLGEDPGLRVALLSIVEQQTLPLIRKVIHDEIYAFSRQLRGPTAFSIEVAVLGILLQLPPLFALLVGLVHATR